MNTAGWLKLHRKMLEWALYKDLPAFRLFTHLLLTVDYRSRQDGGETLPAGSRKATVQELAEETGLTPKQVRWTLEKLVAAGCIRWSTRRKAGGVATVCNWEEYQGESAEESENMAKTMANKMAIISASQITENQTVKRGDGNNDGNNIGNNISNNPCVPIKNIKEIVSNNACACARMSDVFPDITLESVLACAVAQGCNWSEDDAREYVAHYESIGWVLPSGSRITNWKARIKAFDSYRHNNQNQQQQQAARQFDPKAVGTGFVAGVAKWQ